MENEVYDVLGNKMCVKHFIMSAYLYYVEGISVLSDHEYDTLFSYIQQEFSSIDSPYKSWVSIESSTSSMFDQVQDMTEDLKADADEWYKEAETVKRDWEASQ